MTDRETLRRLAEDATPGEMYAGGVKAQQFRDAADPPTVLALLDALARAEAEVKRLREGGVGLREQAHDESQTHWARCEEASDDADLDRANREADKAEIYDQTVAALARLLDEGDDQ